MPPMAVALLAGQAIFASCGIPVSQPYVSSAGPSYLPHGDTQRLKRFKMSYIALSNETTGEKRVRRSESQIELEQVNDASTHQSRPRTPSWRRTARFSGLLLTTIASTTLLVLHLSGWHANDTVSDWIVGNRATTQLVIQIIAGIFGLIQIGAISELINVSVRRRLRTQAMRLDTLHFWISIAQDRLDWNVRSKLLAPLMVFCIATAVPAAVWAGALAPLFKSFTIHQDVNVPGWGSFPSADWFGDLSHLYQYGEESVRTNMGVFIYAVGLNQLGMLAEAAKGATPVDGNTSFRAKPDTSQYVYSGRNYGVGSLVGVTDKMPARNYSSYFFEEIGYKSDVFCIYNQTADYHFRLEVDTGSLYNIWQATGELPNTDVSKPLPGDSFAGYYDDDYLISFGTITFWPLTRDRYRFVAMAAGRHYSFLDSVQCRVEATPTRFNVSVAPHTRTISVSPTMDLSADEDINPTQVLLHTGVQQLIVLTHNSFGWDYSLFGEALRSNIENYRRAHEIEDKCMSSALNNPACNRSPNNLLAIEDSVAAILDDIFVGYGSAQAMVSQDVQRVAGTFNLPAIAFGTTRYIFASFAINAIVVLLVAIQGIGTRLWSQKLLPDFDLLDPRSIVVASSKGGERLGVSAERVGIGEQRVKLQSASGESDSLVCLARSRG